MSVNEKMTAIADAIRDKTGGTEKLGLDDMATDIPKVYEAGKQAENDAFWDSYQDYGNRGNYVQAFRMWRDNIFYPKYDIKPIEDANNMFYDCRVEDIDQRLKDCGVTLDTSEVTLATNLFAAVKSRVVPEASFINATSLTGAYGWTSTLKEIKNIVLRNDGTNTFGTTFRTSPEIEKISITGVIGTDFDIKYSPKLTVDSMKSIILALKNYKGTDYDNTYTVSFHSTALANLEAEGATAPGNITWTEYIQSKGWKY